MSARKAPTPDHGFKTTTLHISKEIEARADAIAEKLTLSIEVQTMLGASRASRSAVYRLALDRGLASLEREIKVSAEIRALFGGR